VVPARNRLTSATSGALVWNYAYNAREQLVSRTLDTGGDLTHFVHDIFGNVIAETNGTGPAGTTREYPRIKSEGRHLAAGDGDRAHERVARPDRPTARRRVGRRRGEPAAVARERQLANSPDRTSTTSTVPRA
jgi:YD repeat-containing protein